MHRKHITSGDYAYCTYVCTGHRELWLENRNYVSPKYLLPNGRRDVREFSWKLYKRNRSKEIPRQGVFGGINAFYGQKR